MLTRRAALQGGTATVAAIAVTGGSLAQAGRLVAASGSSEPMKPQLGPDWDPPEPEEVSFIGWLGRVANGDPA